MELLSHIVGGREALREQLSGLDAVDAIRAFYILATCMTLAVAAIPPINSRFVLYGARASGSTSDSKRPDQSSKSSIVQFLDRLALWKVPHRYFIHFYILSSVSSAFWIMQLLTRGTVFRTVVANMSDGHLQKSMSIHQVIVCTILMVMHGGRRLYENIVFAKPSASQMWVIHWLLGLAFYAATTIAVWIEGTGSVQSTTLTLDDVRVTTVPSVRTLLCVPLFLVASGIQHDCHHYLASLKTYTVPLHPLFSRIVCPHYTAECVIYLALAFLGAPQEDIVNETILYALLFVVVNLGVTAASSKQWHIQKFGADSVRRKWKMIPPVF